MENQKIIFAVKHLILIFIAGSFITKPYLKIRLDHTLTKFGYIHLFTFSLIFLYYNFKLHKVLLAFIKKRKELKEKTSEEIKIIQDFLNDKFNYSRSVELKNLIENIENYDFLPKVRKKYYEELQEKMVTAKKLLEEFLHKEKIQKLKEEKEELESQIKSIIYLKKEETMNAEEKKEQTKELMNLEENKVFIKKQLDAGDVEILKEEGYKQANQYSIQEEKNITVLVKSPLNHSVTHTFLVWEIKNLLEYMDMEDVKEHQTKDADITFKHRNKTHAIEVETGSLLKKKIQAKEKVEYMNKKYKNKWLFVVSNKNLLTEYKKFGFATQRTQVEKTLKKWLKIDT